MFEDCLRMLEPEEEVKVFRGSRFHDSKSARVCSIFKDSEIRMSSKCPETVDQDSADPRISRSRVWTFARSSEREMLTFFFYNATISCIGVPEISLVSSAKLFQAFPAVPVCLSLFSLVCYFIYFYFTLISPSFFVSLAEQRARQFVHHAGAHKKWLNFYAKGLTNFLPIERIARVFVCRFHFLCMCNHANYINKL